MHHVSNADARYCVCPSRSGTVYSNDLTYHHTFFSTVATSIIPVFSVINMFFFQNFDEALNISGVYKFRNFQPISGCIVGIQERHIVTI